MLKVRAICQKKRSCCQIIFLRLRDRRVKRKAEETQNSEVLLKFGDLFWGTILLKEEDIQK